MPPKDKHTIYFIAKTNRHEEKGNKQMKDAPEKITGCSVFRPGEPVKMAIWVFDWERDDSKVVNDMAAFKKSIEGSKKTLAKATRFRSIITGQNLSGELFFLHAASFSLIKGSTKRNGNNHFNR